VKIRERCRQLWEEPGTRKGGSPFALLLEIFSHVYRVGVSLRNGLYDRELLRSAKLPCRVISVGNVTAGGTGKTPMVVLLARMLRGKGYRPAVLSRGYGSTGAAPVNIVSDGVSVLLGPHAGGDEPVLIARSCPGVPVLTGPDRRLTGKAAIARLGADVLILDDGFQHRRLFRDLNIVLLDIDRPWGNGYLLPRGPLREPPDRAMKRADLLVRTGERRGTPGDTRSEPDGCNDTERIFKRSLPAFRGTHRPSSLVSLNKGRSRELRDLKGRRICAFAGIAAPERFRGTLESLGADIAAFLAFPDHHRYSSSDIAAVAQAAKDVRGDMIVTTEKDQMKVMSLDLPAIPCFALRIEMTVDPLEDFERLILGVLTKGKAEA
jgi:tetraacyldisaccharide 4'-kinase